jgi:hypothetical protein
MDPRGLAIELTSARWEEWLAAAERMRHGRALLAAAPRRRSVPRATRPFGARPGLLWMLAITALGFWLLRC